MWVFTVSKITFFVVLFQPEGVRQEYTYSEFFCLNGKKCMPSIFYIFRGEICYFYSRCFVVNQSLDLNNK